MYRNFIALAVAGVLAACSAGTNPLNSSDPEAGVGTGEQPLVTEPDPDENENADPNALNVYGEDANADLFMDNMSFDASTGELVLNALPYDGEESVYTRDAARSAGLARGGSTFDVFTNAAGSADYYAVFRRSDSGYSQVGAVALDPANANDRLAGGVAAQRLRDIDNDPIGAFTFTGEYAAVRTVQADSGTDIQYVAGTVTLNVDTTQADGANAVSGNIDDRTFFDANGALIAELTNANEVYLSLSDIDYTDWTIGSASAIASGSGTTTVTGTWDGILTGPNGEEIAGIVVLEGDQPVGIDPVTGGYTEVEVREAGGFIAAR
ncbi:hypothetical protein [Tropicibacter naphthalenivorans]|uniref:Transferrin binding protein-like solute binding protein n=1 Tax=Tropicibacter naphthalenivorans TaxID=441103 RepID=A0A0P1GAS9_9RHOB|nr:hypothetical protein [Tropicibacter naphthalenivorans]CUH78582.1 hypothetical protein TRN7648_02049 [Tropicibacter naphthalenivorans]SMC80970.1 hypothetical protein SAMN04488093_104211 [Tropicibacter naphthalenivorans]